MKLKKIKIINFGQFSNLSFDLPSDELNVFFGKNEAGKSTTVAFIKQIMFGFYLRSNSSQFFEDYKPLANVSPMGGSLYFEDEENGDRFELERLWTKGESKRGVLTIKKDGEVVPESVFFDRIHNIDGNFYADSFIFNQEMLGHVAGLSQNDLLEQIYYLGASNSSQLLEERDNFKKSARNLFKKTGKKPEVNRLLQQLLEQREEVVQNQDEFNEYKKIQADFDQQESQLRQLQLADNKLKDEKVHLTDLKKELENYQKLQKLQAENKEITFDSKNYQKAQELVAQEKTLDNAISAAESQLQQLGEQKTQDYTKLLQKKPEILQLQTEDRTCRQKADQIKAEEEQILALTPEVGQVLNFDHTQVQQLKTDFNNLPAKIQKTDTNSQNQNFITTIGIAAAVLGLVLLMFAPSAATAIIVGGIAISGYGFYQKGQLNKQEQAENEKIQKANAQRAAFEQKYQLNPDDLDIKNLLLQYNQYQLKLQEEEKNSQRLYQIHLELEEASNNLQSVLDKPIKADFKAVLAALDKIFVKANDEQHQNDKKLELQANLKNNQTNKQELILRLKAILAQAGVKNMAEYDQLYQDYLAHMKLEAQIESIKSSLGTNLDELEKLGQNSKELTDQFDELNEKLAAKNEQITQLQQSIAQAQIKLENLADSDKVFETKQDLANTETQFIDASQDYLANLLVSEWISRALDIASNERFPKMLKNAKEYFNLLTGGKYTDIILEKKLSVVRKDGKKREVKYLSRGTGEQLYFALKLAFIEQIKDKINLPILIDDSFVNFDNERLEYIDQLLNKLAKHNQVLIFTAQENLVEKLKVRPLTFERNTNA